MTHKIFWAVCAISFMILACDGDITSSDHKATVDGVKLSKQKANDKKTTKTKKTTKAKKSDDKKTTKAKKSDDKKTTKAKKSDDKKTTKTKKSDEKQADEEQVGEKQVDEKQADEKQADEKQVGEEQADEKQVGEEQADEKQADDNKDAQAGDKRSTRSGTIEGGYQGPGPEPKSEVHRQKEFAQDLADGMDGVKQTSKPSEAPISSLSGMFSTVKSLLVTEHNIPFKVLSFSRSKFTISNPSTISAFVEAAGGNEAAKAECPKCMTTFAVTAKDASGQDVAHFEMYCGGAVSTPVLDNTFTEQCWTIKDTTAMKSLLETASR